MRGSISIAIVTCLLGMSPSVRASDVDQISTVGDLVDFCNSREESANYWFFQGACTGYIDAVIATYELQRKALALKPCFSNYDATGRIVAHSIVKTFLEDLDRNTPAAQGVVKAINIAVCDT